MWEFTVSSPTDKHEESFQLPKKHLTPFHLVMVLQLKHVCKRLSSFFSLIAFPPPVKWRISNRQQTCQLADGTMDSDNSLETERKLTESEKREYFKNFFNVDQMDVFMPALSRRKAGSQLRLAFWEKKVRTTHRDLILINPFSNDSRSFAYSFSKVLILTTYFLTLYLVNEPSFRVMLAVRGLSEPM